MYLPTLTGGKVVVCYPGLLSVLCRTGLKTSNRMGGGLGALVLTYRRPDFIVLGTDI